MSELVIAFYFILIFVSVFFMIRTTWLFKERSRWASWVHEYNMREIERVAREDPFALKYLGMKTTARYAALLSYDRCFWKIFTWNLDGLVADRERYEEVMRFHEQRKETLQ